MFLFGMLACTIRRNRYGAIQAEYIQMSGNRVIARQKKNNYNKKKPEECKHMELRKQRKKGESAGK